MGPGPIPVRHTSSIWPKELGDDVPHFGYRPSLLKLNRPGHLGSRRINHTCGGTWVIVDSGDLIPHYALLYHDEYHIEDYEPIVVGHVKPIRNINSQACNKKKGKNSLVSN